MPRTTYKALVNAPKTPYDGQEHGRVVEQWIDAAGRSWGWLAPHGTLRAFIWDAVEFPSEDAALNAAIAAGARDVQLTRIVG